MCMLGVTSSKLTFPPVSPLHSSAQSAFQNFKTLQAKQHFHLASLSENVLLWKIKIIPTALYVMFTGWSLSYTDSSAWNVPPKTRGKQVWMLSVWFGQLKILTKPNICCLSNSPNSSNICVYKVACQRIWCMTVSLMGRQGPTRAWKLFSHFSERKRRCEIVGISCSPTVHREEEREEV